MIPVAYAEVDSAALAYTCTGCHGPEGKSRGTVPSLHGLGQDEVEKSLQGFKSGEEKSTIMNRIISGFSDEEIEAVATLFSGQKKEDH